MRIGYLVFNLDGMGGTSRSAITQANALAGDHAVTLLSVTRSGERPHYWIDERDQGPLPGRRARGSGPVGARGRAGSVAGPGAARARLARRPRRAGTASSPRCATSALEHVLPGLKLDVLVTVTPGLLAAAIQLLPPEPVVVHQEHRSTSDRSSGLEPLLNFAPRADVVAVLHPRDGRLGPRAARRLHPRDRDRARTRCRSASPRARASTTRSIDDGRPAGQREAVPAPDRGLRPGRRPAARLAAAHLRHRPEAAGAAAPRPQARPLRPRRAARRRAPTCAASGPRRASARSPRAPRASRWWSRRRWPPASPSPATTAPPARARSSSTRSTACSSRPSRSRAWPRPCCGWPPTTTCAARLGEGAFRTSRQYDAYAIAERWVGIFSAARTRRTVAGRLTPRVTALVDAKPVPKAAGRGGRGHRRDAGAGARGDPRLGRRGRHGEQRPLAGDPGARVGRARSSWCRWPTATPSSRSSATRARRRTSPCATPTSTAGPSAAARSSASARTCDAG